MDAIFCTCNRTVPLDRLFLAKQLDNGASVRVFDALCREGAEALTQRPANSGAVFVGCEREADALRAALEEAGYPAHGVLTWDVRRWLRGLSAHGASRGAAAYARAARCLVEAATPIPRSVVSVGPRVVVSGPGAAPLAEGLGEYLEVVWVGEADPPGGVRVLPGRITAVEGSLGAFTVRVRTGTPVDPLVCVDCGACRESCPRHALDRWYRLDPERCDACGRCEEACTRIGALDLQAHERTVPADQVIWMGGQVDTRPGLHAPETDRSAARACASVLAMALQGEVEANPTVVYDSAGCNHGYAGHRGCERCLSVCPTGALSGDGKEIAVRDELCSGCGSCVGICPTGALDAIPWGVHALGKALRTFVSALDEPAQVALVCAECGEPAQAPGGFLPFPFPKLSVLDAGHILGALAAGARQVAVAPCPRCVPVVEQTCRIAFDALELAGQEGRFRWGDRGAAKDFDPDAPPRFPRPTAEPPDAGKRPMLAAWLAPLVHASSGDAPPLEGPFGTLRVDGERCTGCGACVGACRTGALRSDTGRMALLCTEALCTGCSLCACVCPETAIWVEPGLRWSPAAFAEREVARGEGWACPRCGKVFGTRRALDAVFERLAGRLPETDAELLRLCPDCRVVSALLDT